MGQSGQPKWHYNDIPGWTYYASRGDEENFLKRLSNGMFAMRPACGSASWSAPTIGGDGPVYAIQDKNDDGIIDNQTEVSTFDLGASSLHPGPSLAPGMLAHASCDGVFVFRT